MASVSSKNRQPNIQVSAKKASTAFAIESVVAIDSNGFIAPAVAASANIAGISLEKVVSTDSDYASTRAIAFDYPRPGERFVMEFNTTPTQTMVGEFFDLADADTLDNSTGGTVNHARIVGIINATDKIVEVEFNPAIVFSA